MRNNKENENGNNFYIEIYLSQDHCERNQQYRQFLFWILEQNEFLF